MGDIFHRNLNCCRVFVGAFNCHTGLPGPWLSTRSIPVCGLRHPHFTSCPSGALLWNSAVIHLINHSLRGFHKITKYDKDKFRFLHMITSRLRCSVYKQAAEFVLNGIDSNVSFKEKDIYVTEFSKSTILALKTIMRFQAKKRGK